MLAFTFPGQGSQRPGMGRPWADQPAWALVGIASELAGRDVARLLLEAEADELTDTRNAQLCTFVVSCMALEEARRAGLEAGVCAGHSLGEYSALVAAGILDFRRGVTLVCERAAAMHDAGMQRPGTMAAVLGLDDATVEAACARTGAEVWVANYNAPGQVVIAGSPAGVEAGIAQAKELGAKKAMPLAVSGAFHTPFMAAARDRLSAAIASAGLGDGTVPVVANVDAAPHQRGDDWAALLDAQLSSPVRWHQSVATMTSLGVDTYVELGAGNVLTALAKRAAPGARAIAVSSPDDLASLQQELEGAASGRSAR